MKKEEGILAIIRISLGFIFLWAFFDKLIGLGFNTPPERAWILGASPTFGFLNSLEGYFSSIFLSLTGKIYVDWIFMIGIFLIGLCLLLGIAKKITGYSGALLLFLMWLALLPLEHNPFLDDHLVYALILIFLAHTTTKVSLSKWWSKIKIVKKYPILN